MGVLINDLNVYSTSALTQVIRHLIMSKYTTALVSSKEKKTVLLPLFNSNHSEVGSQGGGKSLRGLSFFHPHAK